ncbi:MAG: hypothetical protein Q8M02_09185 [Candidatus Didemnitutus sp.]|nr:hypothetical protein [Candidatus Didemnitutus sp.]
MSSPSGISVRCRWFLPALVALAFGGATLWLRRPAATSATVESTPTATAAAPMRAHESVEPSAPGKNYRAHFGAVAGARPHAVAAWADAQPAGDERDRAIVTVAGIGRG